MPEETKSAEGEEQLVVFALGGESYAVDIGVVREIVRLQHITGVPKAATFVEGVINLRGRVIPVVDLRKRFDLVEAERGRASRIVVMEVDQHTIGVVVDEVSEVLRVSQSVIEPPSPLVTNVDSRYLRGIAKLDDRMVMLLSPEAVLAIETMAA